MSRCFTRPKTHRDAPRQARRPTRLAPGEFFGVNCCARRTPEMILSETVYPGGLEVPYHEHRHAYFCLLLDGRYTEEYGRRRVDYKASSVVFHPAGEEHHGTIGSTGGRCFHVEIGTSWLDRLDEFGGPPRDAVDRHSGDLVWLAHRLYQAFRSNDPGTPLMMEGIALEMLGALTRSEPAADRRPPDWLRWADDYLRAHFARRLSVADVAAELGVEPVRLARAFRKHFKLSIGERQRQIRVRAVADRVRCTDMPLTTIALEAGFADQSHMTRVFKRVTGFTPGALRRTIRSG